MSLSNEDIVEAIKNYQERLDRYVSHSNNEKILYVLGKLRKLPIKTIHLEETGVGRTVNALKKLGDDVGENAKDLVSHWKMMVVEEEQAAQEAAKEEDNVDSAVESAPDSSFSENEQDNSENAEELQIADHNEPSEDEDNHSSHRLSDTNKYESDYENTSKKERSSETHHKQKSDKYNKYEEKKSKREKDRRSEKHSSKRKRDSSSGSEVEERSKQSSREKYHSKRKRGSSESSNEADYEKKKSKHRRGSSPESYHNKHKSKSEREEEKSKSKPKEKDSTDRRNREDRSESKQKADNKSSKHEHDEKSNRKEKIEHKKDRHSEKESKSKYESSKSSKNDKDSSKSKSHSEKNDKEKREKEKSKKEVSDKHISSKEKENREKDKEHKPREKDKEKPSHSKSKNEKEKSRSSSSNDHSSSKTDKSEKKSKENKDQTNKPKNSERILHGIDSESGASFAEALGMCEPVRTSKTSSKKKSLPSTSSTVDKSERSSDKSSSRSSSFRPELSDDPDEKYVPELLKEPKLEPINLHLSSLLPEITPNYRPVCVPIDNQPKRFISDDEALSRVMSNKNLRTKVYSGNKTVGKVESLFELCVRILQDNIDALEYTGGVPFLILKPVLEKATPDQLFNMEHHNPYLIDDTDDLWKLHCQKEFRTKKKEELESWRDMYMRCLDEREARLNAITANIKQSQEKSIPVRTAKLAYIDSVAKPPRNIAKRQAKNGIVNEQKQTPTAKLSALATAGEAGKVAVPNPGSRAAERSSSSSSTSSSNNKPKKAPLMAKTLSFLKNRFRR